MDHRGGGWGRVALKLGFWRKGRSNGLDASLVEQTKADLLLLAAAEENAMRHPTTGHLTVCFQNVRKHVLGDMR